MSIVTRPSLAWPDMHGRFDAGSPIDYRCSPVEASEYELRVIGTGLASPLHVVTDRNFGRVREGLPAGAYRAWIRCRPWPGVVGDEWSPWSFDRRFTSHDASDRARRDLLRDHDRRLALICDRDASGVVTLLDPWGIPPNCESLDACRWFPTAAYEGRTPIFNEEPAYYRDPLGYLGDCLELAGDRGFEFLTWHDLLDGRTSDRGIILQFDVDGGLVSMGRVGSMLRERMIRASVMTHLAAADWYEYTLGSAQMDDLQALENEGWTVGYHNNALGTEQHLHRARGDYGPETLARAATRFASDVASLRQALDIRTYTHHGGNVLNLRTPAPSPELGIVGVDKPVNPDLWKGVRSQFSDGGMLVRPVTLREHVENLGPGVHFIRCHPFKYGNYEPPFDSPPLAGGTEFEKQMSWLDERDRLRMRDPMIHRNRAWPLSGSGRVEARFAPGIFFAWLVARHFDRDRVVRLAGDFDREELEWLVGRGFDLDRLPSDATPEGPGGKPDGTDIAIGSAGGAPISLVRAVADTDPNRGSLWSIGGESWTPDSLASSMNARSRSLRIECLGHRIYALAR